MRVLAITLLSLTITATASAQHVVASLGGPFSREAVLNAPFSVDAATTIHETYSDGTVRTRSITARYFRDSRGQVRAEMDTPWGTYVIVTHAGPERMEVYLLDPAIKRAYGSLSMLVGEWVFNGESGLAIPVGKNCFEYQPLAADGATDGERLEAVNAEVSELGLVRASTRFDEIPVTGTKGLRVRRSIHYALTHIRHEEPPASLFEIPADYTLVSSSGGREDTPIDRFTPPRSPAACGPFTER